MNKLTLIAKGMAMGIAEAIPGVSGGTIAFITGIYEELIETIKSITPSNILKLKQSFRQFWDSINGAFIIPLLIGMGLGLGLGVLVIGQLLDTQKEILWSLFFGIVLASCFYLGKNIIWKKGTILLFVLGTVISYGITLLPPSLGSENLLYVFIVGCVAISALMLPGISGSFILLLLGLYEIIIQSVKALLLGQDSGGNLVMLTIFGLGLLTGLFSFARVLSFSFRKYYHSTLSFLVGVLLGSLNKLWPWKKIVSALNTETGNMETIQDVYLPDKDLYKILAETNLSPFSFKEYGDPKLIGVILAFCGGLILVYWMSRVDKKENYT